MTPERSTEQPRVARPTVEQVQILTLKHSADDAGAEPPASRGPPMAVERAAPGARAAPDASQLRCRDRAPHDSLALAPAAPAGAFPMRP